MGFSPMYEVRFYREWVKKSGLVNFQVARQESDLMVRATRDLRQRAEELLDQCRSHIEAQIRQQPEFATNLTPLPVPAQADPIILTMIEAARAYDVGPMAAVAGAVAQFVGEGLLRWSPEVIVENGGDIYLKVPSQIELGLYAGEDSPFSGEIRLRVNTDGQPLGVCTSSGTVGHSLSFGRADAVVALADSAAVADAAATAIGNRIASPDNLAKVLNEEKERGVLQGLLIVAGKRIGAYGAIELAN